MVRIQDSQSWHRGSIPLSTTSTVLRANGIKDFRFRGRSASLTYSLKGFCKIVTIQPFIFSRYFIHLPHLVAV